MAFKVEQSPQFEKSLFKMLDYLTSKIRSGTAAGNLMREIDRVQMTLEATPFIKAVSQKPYLAKRELREYYVSNYVVLYAAGEETVTLVNLFHQSQDYSDPRNWDE